ncbi:MAG: C40 family peptidase [Firmicutes bacterium]|nr:C40 family peptidase [Bacillota bacterium]
MHIDIFEPLTNESLINNFGIQQVQVTILGPSQVPPSQASGTAACRQYAGSVGGAAAGGNGGGNQGAGTGADQGSGNGGAGGTSSGAGTGTGGNSGNGSANNEGGGSGASGSPAGGASGSGAGGASGSGGGSSPSPSAFDASIVHLALSQVGDPYVWGGTTPNGFDCSGLVQWVFAQAGVQLPRLSGQQYRATARISKAELQPGDLVFFQTYKPGPSHVGIYIGSYGGIAHAFVAADNPRVGVEVDNLDSAKWTRLYYGAGRVNLP